MIALMSKAALVGKRILLTRSAHQNEPLAARLSELGATPITLPCLELTPLPDSIDAGIAMLPDYSDVLFSSANGVQCTAEHLRAKGQELSDLLHEKRVAAVGRHTAARLADYGVRVDLVPEQASQDGLIDSYRKQGLPKAGLLFFRAEEGRDALEKALRLQHVHLALIPA